MKSVILSLVFGLLPFLSHSQATFPSANKDSVLLFEWWLDPVQSTRLLFIYELPKGHDGELLILNPKGSVILKQEIKNVGHKDITDINIRKLRKGQYFLVIRSGRKSIKRSFRKK